MPPLEQFQSIWSQALQEYENDTGVRLEALSKAKPRTPEELIKHLDARNKSYEEWRLRFTKLRKVLTGMCQPIMMASQMLKGAASNTYPPASICFSAVIFLISATQKTSKALDAVSQLFEDLGRFLVRLSRYVEEDIPEQLQRLCAEILGTLLQVIGCATKILKRKTSRLKIFGKILLTDDDKISILLERLDRYTKEEARLIAAETFISNKRQSIVLGDVIQVTRRIDETTAATSAHLEDTDNSRKKLADSEHLDKILNPVLNPEEHLQKILKNRVKNTGDWFFTESFFGNWLDGDDPLLYVSGGWGSGKTYLSGHVIRYLQDRQNSLMDPPKRTSVAYHFFREEDDRTRGVHQALKEVAYQICKQDEAYAEQIMKNNISSYDIGGVRNAWTKLFLDVVRSQNVAQSSVLIVMDGCDEASREEFQQWTSMLDTLNTERFRQNGLPILRIAMFGRPDIASIVEERIERVPLEIEIAPGKTGSDISYYVQRSVRTRLSSLPLALKNHIVDVLRQKANGVFLWVDLMIQQLSKLGHREDIEETLKGAPSGIPEMITRVLETTSKTIRDEEGHFPGKDLNTLLAWITLSPRPLTLRQLQAIFNLQYGPGNSLLGLEVGLRTKYPSLFVLARPDGLSTTDLQSRARSQDLTTSADEISADDSSLETVEKTPTFKDFDSDVNATFVTFAHSSIRDYFQNKDGAMVSFGPEYPGIGVRLVDAKCQVLLSYLDAVCHGDDEDMQRDLDLIRTHASRNGLALLKSLTEDLQELPKEMRSKLTQKLTKVLRSSEAMDSLSMRGYNMFDEVVDAEWLDMIMKWFDDDSIDSLSEEEREWRQQFLNDPAYLLRALLNYYGKLMVRYRDLSSKAAGKKFYSSPMTKYIMARVSNVKKLLAERSPSSRLDANTRAPSISFDTVYIMKRARRIKTFYDNKRNLKVTTKSIGWLKELYDHLMAIEDEEEEHEGGSSITSTGETKAIEDVRGASELLWNVSEDVGRFRLALDLRDLDQYSHAETELAAILQQSPSFWPARSELAALKMRRGELAEALKDLHCILPELSERRAGSDTEWPLDVDKTDVSNTLSTIAVIYKKLGDVEQYEQFLHRAFEANTENYEACAQLIEHLTQREDFEKTWTVIDSIHNSTEGREWSHLTHLLHRNSISRPGGDLSKVLKLHQHIARSATNTGNYETVCSYYQEAIRSCMPNNSELVFYLVYFWAEVSQLAGDLELANKLFFELTSPDSLPCPLPSSSSSKACLACQVYGRYSQFCIDHAIRQGTDSPETFGRLRELKRIAVTKRGKRTELTRGVAAQCLGFWYALQQDHEKSKFYLRPALVLELRILNILPFDPEHNAREYSRFLHVLISSGEEARSVAIGITMRLCKSTKPLSTARNQGQGSSRRASVRALDAGSSKENAQSTSVRKLSLDPARGKHAENLGFKDESSPIQEEWACRLCNHNNEARMPSDPTKPMNICAVCLTDLCDPCLELIKAGQYAHPPICDAHHSWVKIPAVTDHQRATLRQGQVVYKGGVVEINEFVKDLERDWGLEGKTLEDVKRVDDADIDEDDKDDEEASDSKNENEEGEQEKDS